MAPKAGDIVVFTSDYVCLDIDMADLTIEKGDMAEIVAVKFSDRIGGDEVFCVLILGYMINEKFRFFEFNYSLHDGFIKNLGNNKKTASILYEKAKI